MRASMQGSRDGFLDAFLRQVQSADYESAYAMSTGSYSLFGMLPVLPGPCALLRYKAIEKKVGKNCSLEIMNGCHAVLITLWFLQFSKLLGAAVLFPGC